MTFMPLSKDDARRVNTNIEKLEKLVEKTPDATHIYLRRPDGVSVDIPINTAAQTIKSHPDWKVEDLGEGDTPQHKSNLVKSDPNAIASDRTMTNEERAEARAKGEPAVPPKPSEEGKDTSDKKDEAPKEEAKKSKYKALADLEFPKGTAHKKGDTLELTEAQAKSFADGLIKKKGLLG